MAIFWSIPHLSNIIKTGYSDILGSSLFITYILIGDVKRYVDPALCALVECSNGIAKQQCPIKCAATTDTTTVTGDTIDINKTGIFLSSF